MSTQSLPTQKLFQLEAFKREIRESTDIESLKSISILLAEAFYETKQMLEDTMFKQTFTMDKK